MRVAKRIESLPPYLFAKLDEKLEAKRAEGVDVISLGVGDPDLPTPPHIVEAMVEALRDPETHRYPSYYGTLEFRTAVADWYRRRFGVELDSRTEVITLIGSKEGLAHLAFALVDQGDEVLVSDPGYPVYGTSTLLAGGTPLPLPLVAEHGFLPDLDAVPVSERTKLAWLNFPGNPTGAVAGEDTFERAVAWAAEHGVLLAHDAAYSEITFDGYLAPSILQTPGAREVAIEFNSLSKFNNMTGWRVGFCVGNAEAINALGVVKTNIDSGVFTAIQRAGVAALEGPQDHVEELRRTYGRRRDRLISTLNGLGWDLGPPRGSIYVWIPVPDGDTSVSFADRLLDEAGVFVAPGNGYGEHGEGYVRASLTVPDDRLEEALERIGRTLGR